MLKNYTILELQGKDAITLLNSLSTNLIEKSRDDKNIIYSCILTPNGRFMYDYLFLQTNNKFYVAINENVMEDFTAYISMFKINLEMHFLTTNLLFKWSKDAGEFRDSRHHLLGFWSLIDPTKNNESDDTDAYHLHRITLNIVDGYYDLTQKESIILDYGLDSLNAINYTKGCYLGQELIARTHHTGVIRKRVYHFECDNALQKGLDIFQNDVKVGKVLGGLKGKYLAVIKFEDVDFSKHCIADGNSFLLIYEKTLDF